MDDNFRSLLPSSSVVAERAQERATTEPIKALNTNMVRQVKNPDECPLDLLPWLAWEYAVDFWDETWTEVQKRQVIKDAAYVHQHRGTAGAVRRSLSSVGIPALLKEWWQDDPVGEPYTFRIEVYSQQAIDGALYDRIRRQVNKAKNLRSTLSSIDVIADIGSSGTYFTAGAVTMHIDIEIQAGD